jgi:hypothetical protein
MLIGIYGLEKHMIIILNELITMEFVFGLLSFVGEVISAIAAWSYFQANLTTI